MQSKYGLLLPANAAMYSDPKVGRDAKLLDSEYSQLA